MKRLRALERLAHPSLPRMSVPGPTVGACPCSLPALRLAATRIPEPGPVLARAQYGSITLAVPPPPSFDIILRPPPPPPTFSAFVSSSQ